MPPACRAWREGTGEGKRWSCQRTSCRPRCPGLDTAQPPSGCYPMAEEGCCLHYHSSADGKCFAYVKMSGKAGSASLWARTYSLCYSTHSTSVQLEGKLAIFLDSVRLEQRVDRWWRPSKGWARGSRLIRSCVRANARYARWVGHAPPEISEVAPGSCMQQGVIA